MSQLLSAVSAKEKLKLKHRQQTLHLTAAVRSPLTDSGLSRRSGHVDCLDTPCPKCNKRTLIQRSHNRFDCLNCNFHKQLPPVHSARYASPLSSAPRSLTPTGSYDRSRISRYDLEESGSNSLTGRRQLGQGGLSRLIETTPSYTHRSHDYGAYKEFDATQPLIFAAIAVIIGLFIL